MADIISKACKTTGFINKKKRKLVLAILLVFAIALFFRFWRLSSYPVSLSIDEVTFGYSAYSVLKTGRDENGKFLPLVFKALGDYKPPVDVYLNIPSIAIFGLNEFAVRAPGALLGALSCLLIIFLLRELRISWFGSVFAGLWLAVSGWHIFFSRAGYEAITALFFLLIGTLTFLIWTRRGSNLFFLSSITAFSFSVWSYHAERLFVPLLVIFLLIVFRKKLIVFRRDPKKLLLPLIVLMIFAIPFVYLTFSSADIKARALDLWLTRDVYLSQKLHKDGYSSIQEFVFDNNTYLVFKHWTGQYLNYFDLKFWFWKGIGLTPANFPDVGLLYLIDLPIFFLGVYALLKSKNKLLKKTTLFWFLAGPLPGSFTRGDPSPIRILIWVPFFAFVLGSGADWFFRKSKQWWFIVIYSLFLIFNIGYFFNIYIHNFQNFYSDIWHYGYKEAVQYACENKDSYEKIIITDKYGIEPPSIKTVPHFYVLFHCEFDPKSFQETRQLFNIEGRQPHWRIDSRRNNTLLIGSSRDFPEGFPEEKIMKKIYFLNDKPALYFVETDKK